MSSIQIRTGDPLRDGPTVQAIAQTVFAGHSGSFALAEKLGDPRMIRFFTACRGEETVGYGMVWTQPEPRLEIIVAPAHRRQGIGILLWQHLLSTLHDFHPVTLHGRVFEEETGGLAFCRRCGFTEDHRMEKVYLSLPDAVLPERKSDFFVKMEERNDGIYFIAPQGSTQLMQHPGSPRDLLQGLTIVEPPYCGQGIAKQLKRAGIEYAIQHGYRGIYSAHRNTNDAMKHINESLGFRRYSSEVRLYRSHNSVRTM